VNDTPATELTNPATQFAIVAVVIWGTILLLKAIKPFIPVKVGPTHASPTASNEFWEARNGQIAHIVSGKLDERILPVLERQTEILSEMSKGISELVIIQRDDRLRKAAAGRT
jgi:hypothetical protein